MCFDDLFNLSICLWNQWNNKTKPKKKKFCIKINEPTKRQIDKVFIGLWMTSGACVWEYF